MRTAQKLQAASKALLYDVQMLDATAKELSSRTAHASTLNNALLESFLIHLRNLIDVLYIPKSKRNPDDINAEDFFSDPEEWRRIVKPLKRRKNLGALKTRINKLLAHLTYKRLSAAPSYSEWDVAHLRSEIAPGLVAFCENATDERLDGELARTVRSHWS
jgi:hypothetical protein